jgi:hypothetical protein
MARTDELEFRQQVLRELGVLSDYVQRERSVLLKEIADLRERLQQIEQSEAASRNDARAPM